MESLYELARLNFKNRTLVEKLIPEKDSSPLKKLAQIAFEQNALTDEECIILIYGKRNLTAFSRLKTRLKELFYQALLIQEDFTSDNLTSSKSISNLRKTVAARILHESRSVDLAIELMEKAIAQSIKNNFTENVVVQVRYLLSTYASYRFNKYKYKKYSELQQKYLQIYSWELKADGYFFDLQKNQMQTLANPTGELIEKASRYIKELDGAKDINTPNFIFSKYRIHAIHYEYKKDFLKLLQISDNAIKIFTSPNLKAPVVVSNIYVRKLWALIQAGRSDTAISFGNKILSETQAGSKQWYRLAHYILKAHLYLGDYKNAIELFVSLYTNPKYQKLDSYYLEIFNTTLGYLHLILDSGIIDEKRELKKKMPDFKLGKYLNATPVFSKDKRGINVSILLMHVAFLLQRQDYNSIIDKMDSLNQYAYRYLRKDDSFRSNCMIKMVIQMARADFNSIRTERYTASLYNQLSSVNLAGSGENIEIEIIPFEVLWDIMMKSLRD